MLRRLFVVAASAALLAACQQQAAAPAAENASAPAAAQEGLAPAFTLVDADGVQRSLADFRGKTVVLEWTNEGCPYVQKQDRKSVV